MRVPCHSVSWLFFMNASARFPLRIKSVLHVVSTFTSSVTRHVCRHLRLIKQIVVKTLLMKTDLCCNKGAGAVQGIGVCPGCCR
eukprot:42748-Eustigmatos_ZCMA.PRE.1